MQDYRLSATEIADLRAAHRVTRDVREAYRINAVILLAQGRPAADVADALLIDPDTVRSYYKRYKKGIVQELLRMSFVGSEALLDADQLRELDRHLQDELYPTAEAIARFVEQRWGVRYTPSGMTALLHRLGYSYKKAKLEPGRHPAPGTRNSRGVRREIPEFQGKQSRSRRQLLHRRHPSAAQSGDRVRLDQARQRAPHRELHRAAATRYQRGDQCRHAACRSALRRHHRRGLDHRLVSTA